MSNLPFLIFAKGFEKFDGFSNKIISRVNISYTESIINENEYKIYMDELSEVLKEKNIARD